MKIPNADFLERTGSENIGARLWRLPPQSANTLHKHIRQEEFYFVLEGTGRIRVGEGDRETGPLDPPPSDEEAGQLTDQSHAGRRAPTVEIRNISPSRVAAVE